MDLHLILDGNSQLSYQFIIIPFSLLFYYLSRQGRLSVSNRYIYLLVGGFVLSIVTLGPFSVLLVFSAVLLMLIYHLQPSQIHQWMLGLQMCWQTLWHFLIQYQLYWLQETPDSRLLLASSSLMLMTQRVSSLSLDLQEGTAHRWREKHPCDLLLPVLSYSLYFPALLGGPLCNFHAFVEFVSQMATAPPLVFCLGNLALKMVHVLALVWSRDLLKELLKSDTFGINTRFHGILWIWFLSLMFRINYYVHWKVSECVNNAAGMGLQSGPGKATWDGLSDGNAWQTEMSSRPSVFARQWNRTTANWLRRTIYLRYRRCPVFLTFGFSAWWHGLHPGQMLGFFLWAVAVKGDYKLHRFLQLKLTSAFSKRMYVCASWAFTQLTIACVVFCVESQNLASVKFLFLSDFTFLPLVSLLMIVLF